MEFMKKLLVSMCILFVITASAQERKNKINKQPGKTIVTKKSKINTGKDKTTQSPVLLSSTNSYMAKSGISVTSNNNFTISDPTIVALNARANGADVTISNSGIVGMPKRAYGFGNGKLILNSTAATSSGTITGSGAVGTGSSMGSIGSYGPGIGLNGKSPDAGSAMWGNATGLIVQEKKKM